MPFNREATLRNAEKMLRQGRLDLAIADYRAVIEDQPSDWNTANTLGDLYFRAGQVDQAVAEYAKIADHLASEGFLPKAVALYRKILKIKPDEERAMWHLGGIAARQGLLVDARANYLTLAERRRARGDQQGEAEVLVRLGDLDGADLETRLAGAHARAGLGDVKTAVEQLKVAAAALQARGKEADALRLLTESAQIDPEDLELRRLLVQIYVARGDFEEACQFATSAADLKGIADELFQRGRDDEGINVLQSATEADPSDVSIRAQLAKILVARDDIQGARSMLTLNVAGSDPELQWTLAEMELRGGRIPEGTAVLQQILIGDPSRRHALVSMGCAIAEDHPEAGYECVEVAVKDAIAGDDWTAAISALNEFVGSVPHYIPALMRLVEICVDGGFEGPMHSAQARLADAYLVVGAGLEARVIAEDLVAREPWEPANIERFRCALALLGETDIDALIAERLSGQSPFAVTDPPGFAASAPAPVADLTPEAPAPELVPEPRIAIVPPASAVHYPPIDVGIVGPQAVEIDLNGILNDLRHEAGLLEERQPAAPIEAVLDTMRKEAAHDSSPENAEQHFKMAGTYMQMGMTAEAMKALEVAAQAAGYRFRAGAMLGQAYLKAGDHDRAIEWLERAAESPAPSPAAHHALLYDLAGLLERRGESARALAVWLELQSEDREYRDVTARLDQLKVQMGSRC